MASQTLLCVEPDEAVVATIRAALEPHGFAVTNIVNAEEAVSWCKDNPPQLALVSVEPGKVGYNICNKFKRTNDLKGIPLILISGQETPQQFEQHRKLKVRANEYLHKPFSAAQLLDKVRQVIPLDGDPGSSAELLGASEELEEISINEDDIVEEDLLASDEVEIDAGFEGAATRATTAGPADLEAAFDRETEAAFEAIQAADSAPPVGPEVATPRADDPSSPWSLDDRGWEASATSATPADSLVFPEPDAAAATRTGGSGLNPAELFGDTATRAVPDASAAALLSDAIFPPSSAGTAELKAPQPGDLLPFETAEAPAIDDASAEAVGDNTDVLALDRDAADSTLPPGPGDGELELPTESPMESSMMPEVASDTVEVPAAAADASRPRTATAAPPTAAHGVAPELVAELKSLEAEVDKLRRENEALRAGASSSTAERTRAIFELRELLTKKDRDLLDLQEQLAQRERQDLDRKDRVLALERERRNLDEKLLGLEKQLAQLGERLEAALQDKEKLSERERLLRGRLDDAHNEIAKSHDELDATKKRAAANEERLRSDLDRLRGEFESRIATLEAEGNAERERLLQERATAEAALDQAHQAEIGQLRADHAQALQAAAARLEQETRRLEDAHQSDLQRLRREHEQALASLKEEQRGQLQAERDAQQAALEARERDHRNEILGMRKRHEDELLAADGRRQRELADLEARHAEALEAAEERRRAELKQRDEEHHAKLAELDRERFREKTELSERHRSELDQAIGRAAQAEGELAARSEELAETQRRLREVESEADAARAELRDRQVKLSQANSRISELEQKLLGYEEQIMRTFQRMRADEKSVNKAKRALAVALSLLEERGVAAERPTEVRGAAPAGEVPRSDTDDATGAS